MSADNWAVCPRCVSSHIAPVTGVSGPGWRDAAIVPLPPSYPDQPIWEVGDGEVSVENGDVVTNTGCVLTPTDARYFAAALLAAAEEAERQEGDRP